MKLQRAQELATEKGLILQWNRHYNVYDLVPNKGVAVVVNVTDDYPTIRPSWLAIIDEQEFITDYLNRVTEGAK